MSEPISDSESTAAHFRALEAMYQAAPINEFYEPEMVVSTGRATIHAAVRGRFFHAAGAVHGSVYFKMLDDAAFFAANSLEPDVFVLTSSFTTYLTRPVSEGTLRCEGTVVNRTRSQFIAEAVLYDGEDREIARGSGVFVRSRIRLGDVPGYASDQPPPSADANST